MSVKAKQVVSSIAEQRLLATTPVSMLLTPEQVAEKLAVSVAWVRDQTRHRTYVREKDPLPCVRLGKFVRFRGSDIEAWLDRQARASETNRQRSPEIKSAGASEAIRSRDPRLNSA